MEFPVISGHRFCMVDVKEVRSELILSRRGVPCWHSGMPYTTTLNFLSDADSVLLAEWLDIWEHRLKPVDVTLPCFFRFT